VCEYSFYYKRLDEIIAKIKRCSFMAHSVHQQTNGCFDYEVDNLDNQAVDAVTSGKLSFHTNSNTYRLCT